MTSAVYRSFAQISPPCWKNFLIECEKLHSVANRFICASFTNKKPGAGTLVGLRDLGFSKGLILETIVSTCNANGEPNAAPMGITIKTESIVEIRPYVTTTTYQNLASTKCAVINLTTDPELFFITAFKEAIPQNKLPVALFGKAKSIAAPTILTADSHIEVAVKSLKILENEKAEAQCTVRLIESSKQYPQVYCRAKSAAIEAILHATRLEVFLKQGDEKKEQVLDLLERFRICCDVVNRVGPNSRFSNLMSDLTKRIEEWRRESESPS
jgi:hypothetical protein